MLVDGNWFKCSLFDMADEGTEPTKDLNFAKNYPLMEGEGESCKRAVCLAICSGCIGSRMAKFLLFLWWEHIYACSYINIKYALDSTRQKFNV